MRHLFFAAALVVSTLGMAQTNNSELPKLEHMSADQVDKSLDPCDDFSAYACTKFFKQNPIPPDQAAWGTGGPLRKWNEAVQREALESAAQKKQGRTAIEALIGDYWSTCMNEPRREISSMTDLAPELKRIDAIKNKSQLVDEVAHLHSTTGQTWIAGDNSTNAALFGIAPYQDPDDATKVVAQFDQGGFTLPGRDFYLGEDPKSVETRKAYQTHIANMLKLAETPATQSETDAAIVLGIETELARASMDVVKRRDPKNTNNKMTLDQLQQLVPSFDLKTYLKEIHLAPQPIYEVTFPDFFRSLDKVLTTHSIDHWKAYLRWHLMHTQAPYLNNAAIQENFDFFSKTLSGTPAIAPRERRCIQQADNVLGEAVGQAYVARAFPPESKQRVQQLVKAIETALDQDVGTLSWMSDETKRQAKQKLARILDKIGYPDKWVDYSSLHLVPDSFLTNEERATAFEFNRWIQMVGRPTDRKIWTMTPPTINAYYDPPTNTINFPAGILQPPYFDKDQPDASNFGGIGAVIGHEIIHGFDDQGRKYDGQGNLRDWWTAEDGKQYDERGKCISDEYTTELKDLDVKTNGLLTQGEDTADNGGLHIALLALENTLKQKGKSLDSKGEDGLTELQRFYLSFANIWCGQIRPNAARVRVLTNPHSLPKFRINNTVANMPEFAQAFGCKKGQPMVHENSCHIW